MEYRVFAVTIDMTIKASLDIELPNKVIKESSINFLRCKIKSTLKQLVYN